jgi:two-component system, OmpR family, response regulator
MEGASLTDLTTIDGRGSRVLIVDDDEHLSELLVTTLRFAGFATAAAATGTEGLRQVGDFKPHLVVLDVMLPDIEGFDVARRLRADGCATPVLFLTARDATEDKVAGLLLGGDDYITKPFSIAELIARVHAALRRARAAVPEDHGLRYANLYLDDDTCQVRRDGQLLELSPTEFRLLRYLMLNAGRVVSKAQILERVWQYDFAGDAGVVEKFVSNLRRKIDDAPPSLLHTVRGFGYTLRLPHPRSADPE